MEVTIKTNNGREAKLLVKDPKEHIQGYWVHGSFYETQRHGLLSYINAKVYSGRCIDIGASIGNHTIYFSCILGCEVIAIEPHPDSFHHLKENCDLNNLDIELHNIALGSKKRRVSMENKSNEKYNVGMMQVVDGDDTEMDLLDNIVSGQFSFIKIDVEHFNLPLLKGAKHTLINQNECHVFIECETEQMKKDTDKIMISYGYKIDEGVKLNHTPTYLWTIKK